ncbi:MAG: stage II sporulation protein P [Bacillota bacterium]|nr:stage II sporulation protein P [Bacillota bacterium]
MARRKNFRTFAFLMVLVFLGVIGLTHKVAPVWSGWKELFSRFEVERTDGGYYSVLDENHQVIHRTAHRLYRGDEYITAKNMRYRITRVEGDFAYARLVGKEAEVKLTTSETSDPTRAQVIPGQTADQRNAIAIYHTHSDESYVPTDGTDSIYASGGVLKVGNVFAEKLRSMNFNVLHSLRPHDPHDANAYYRSRRTAAQLLQKQPLALIDIHRDAVPPDVYSAVIEDQPVTKIKLVVGRENPRMSSNLQFAKQLKAAVDETHPGLIEGILLSRGDFNQDLAPRSILIEVGSHTNSREAAQRGIALFAEALPKVFGITGIRPEVGPPAPPTNRGDWRALFWGVLIVGGAIAGFLYLNTGSWKGAWEQFRNFFQVEFPNKKRGEK